MNYSDRLSEILDNSPKNKDSFSTDINFLIESIKNQNEDDEMVFRAYLKSKFKLSDEQLNKYLFKAFIKEKLPDKPTDNDCVNMADVEPITYLMDGWLLRGDICLTYGESGAGKTTHALWKAYNYAKGKNILDRNAECDAGKSLFICTDGGVNTFKKAMLDLDIENDAVFKKGSNQKIFVWGYDSAQGQEAWGADINGVIKLEKFIKEKDISNVVIDSAKSVSSRAGISYIDNDAVRVLLSYIREGIAQPNNCHIEFLSHDGTAKGAHAGAKTWREEPSMVIRLKANIDEETKEEKGVTAEFIKDRAANVDPRRTVIYKLENNEMVLDDEKKIVGSCDDVIIEIMKNFYKVGKKKVRRSEIIEQAYLQASAKRKTVDNTLGNMVNNRKLSRPQKGFYSLVDSDIQSVEVCFYGAGSNEPKSIAGQLVCPLPDPLPEEIGGNTLGKSSKPSDNVQSDLITSHAIEIHSSNKQDNDIDPYW